MKSGPSDMTHARIAEEWTKLRAKGWDVALQFTCAACGERNTYAEPNVLPRLATCDSCGAVTDVEAQGGGFAMIVPDISVAERRSAERRRELADPPVDAMEDLARTFAERRLPAPPIPGTLLPAFRKLDDWLWSTREIDRMDMYLFRRYVVEAAHVGLPDYVAVSHGGHGVNSYSLNYHLVLGPLGLFTQVPLGGAYTDDDRAIAALQAQFSRVREIVPLAEAARAEWDGGRRLVVVESHVRRVSICRWVDLVTPHETAEGGGGGPYAAIAPPRGEPASDREPLETAMRELGGSPA